MSKQTNLDISRALKTNDVKYNYNHFELEQNTSIRCEMIWEKTRWDEKGAQKKYTFSRISTA